MSWLGSVTARPSRFAPPLPAGDHASRGQLHCHHRGFDHREAAGYARTILENHAAALPASWLVVSVRSSRRDCGRLLALHDEGSRFFAEERELLEVYARYAASALDSATALTDAQQRYGQSNALLQFARALADAGTSGEIAIRLADAVPAVVDCDRGRRLLWQPTKVSSYAEQPPSLASSAPKMAMIGTARQAPADRWRSCSTTRA